MLQKSPSAHQPHRLLKGNASARHSLFSGYAPHSPLRCPAQVHGQCNVLCIQGCRMALVYLLYLYSCRLKCGIPYRNYDTGSYARFPLINVVPSASYPGSRSPRISFRHVRLPAPARHVFRSPEYPSAHCGTPEPSAPHFSGLPHCRTMPGIPHNSLAPRPVC